MKTGGDRMSFKTMKGTSSVSSRGLSGIKEEGRNEKTRSASAILVRKNKGTAESDAKEHAKLLEKFHSQFFGGSKTAESLDVEKRKSSLLRSRPSRTAGNSRSSSPAAPERNSSLPSSSTTDTAAAAASSSSSSSPFRPASTSPAERENTTERAKESISHISLVDIASVGGISSSPSASSHPIVSTCPPSTPSPSHVGLSGIAAAAGMAAATAAAAAAAASSSSSPVSIAVGVSGSRSSLISHTTANKPVGVAATSTSGMKSRSGSNLTAGRGSNASGSAMSFASALVTAHARNNSASNVVGMVTTPLIASPPMTSASSAISSPISLPAPRSSAHPISPVGPPPSSSSSSANLEALSTDDLLPLFVWLILRSPYLPLHAHVEYMKYFQPSASLLGPIKSELNYRVANLEAALQYILGGDLVKVMIEQQKSREAEIEKIVMGDASVHEGGGRERRDTPESSVASRLFDSLSVPSTTSSGSNTPSPRLQYSTSVASDILSLHSSDASISSINSLLTTQSSNGNHAISASPASFSSSSSASSNSLHSSSSVSSPRFSTPKVHSTLRLLLAPVNSDVSHDLFATTTTSTDTISIHSSANGNGNGNGIGNASGSLGLSTGVERASRIGSKSNSSNDLKGSVFRNAFSFDDMEEEEKVKKEEEAEKLVEIDRNRNDVKEEKETRVEPEDLTMVAPLSERCISELDLTFNDPSLSHSSPTLPSSDASSSLIHSHPYPNRIVRRVKVTEKIPVRVLSDGDSLPKLVVQRTSSPTGTPVSIFQTPTHIPAAAAASTLSPSFIASTANPTPFSSSILPAPRVSTPYSGSFSLTPRDRPSTPSTISLSGEHGHKHVGSNLIDKLNEEAGRESSANGSGAVPDTDLDPFGIAVVKQRPVNSRGLTMQGGNPKNGGTMMSPTTSATSSANKHKHASSVSLSETGSFVTLPPPHPPSQR